LEHDVASFRRFITYILKAVAFWFYCACDMTLWLAVRVEPAKSSPSDRIKKLLAKDKLSARESAELDALTSSVVVLDDRRA
jgi:hypothetical protein